MVGLVEGLTRESVVAYPGDSRGRRSSKREALVNGMWPCTATDDAWYAIHDGCSQVRRVKVWQADVVWAIHKA